MLTRVFNFVRGILCTILICTNMVLHASVILLFGGILWILFGCKGMPAAAQRIILPLQTSWAFLNLLILKISMWGKWDVQGVPLERKEWYLLVSNHQSWVDILVLGGLFCTKAPPFKFFMKKELLWQLPIAGVCCYILGYPLMRRHTRADIRKDPSLKGKDIDTTKKACAGFKKLPTTIINFVEGTRFTEQKHLQQESPFRHLLKPKTGGTAIVLNEMHDYLSGILNVTINYDADHISFFKLLSGDIRKLSIHYEVLPIRKELLGNYYEDRVYRSVIQRWFNDLWERKDTLLDQLNSHEH